MSDECTLRKKAREAMEAGRLPSHLPTRLWGGPGVGACCTICGRPVLPGELELEFIPDGGDGPVGNHHVHMQCFAAWEFEHRNFERVQAAVSPNGGARLASPASAGGETAGPGVTGILPGPGNDRMITAHESDGSDQ